MSSTWMVHLRFRIFGAYGPQWFSTQIQIPLLETNHILVPAGTFLSRWFSFFPCSLEGNIQSTMSMPLQFWDFGCMPKYRKNRKLRLGQVIAFQHLLISAFLLATLVSSVFFFSDMKSQQNLRQDLSAFFGGSFYCLKSNIGDAFLGRQRSTKHNMQEGTEHLLVAGN